MERSGDVVKHLAFDLDGVLIDALHIHRAAFVEAYNAYVGPDSLTEEFHDLHLASLNTKQKIHELISMGCLHGFPFDEAIERISSLKQRLTIERIDNAGSTVPWLRELLGSLKSDGRMIALVSNSIRATCERTLSNIGALEFFDTIVASDDNAVLFNKPNPLPYLLAAANLGEQPSQLVAFEDSVPGLTAAKNAGCWVYVVSRPSVDLEETKVRAWLKTVDAA
jgi:HAD superfamily hydrolase (TIGR01509 family)